jgi:hypothetical protein
MGLVERRGKISRNVGVCDLHSADQRIPREFEGGQGLTRRPFTHSTRDIIGPSDLVV